jgi:hypothetical protein
MQLMTGTSVGLSIAFAAGLVIPPIRADQFASIHRPGKWPATIVCRVASFSLTPAEPGFSDPDADTAHITLLNTRANNPIPAALSIPPEREQSIAQS